VGSWGGGGVGGGTSRDGGDWSASRWGEGWDSLSGTDTPSESSTGWGGGGALALGGALAGAAGALTLASGRPDQRWEVDPAAEARERTLYIAQCPDDVTDEAIRFHWRELGEAAIVSIRWNNAGGMFQGNGMIEFATKELAERASQYAAVPVGEVACLHRLLNRLHMEVDDGDMALRDARTLFHGRCPDSITDDHFLTHYAPLGPDAVQGIRWGTHRDGRFKGFGFVEFKTVDLALAAMELPPLTVDGTPVVRERNGTGGKVSLSLKKARERAAALLYDDQRPRGAQQWGPSTAPFTRDLSHRLRYKTRPPGEAQAFLGQHALTVERGLITPLLEFDEVDFGPEVDTYLRGRFQRPTPLQSLVWPAMLSGRDVIAVAPDGSGKTLAYALPALAHALAQGLAGECRGPSVLIITPAVETVLQIYRDLERFEKPLGLRIGVAHGGADPAATRYIQATKLVSGCELLVATPGRLLDFVERGVTPLDRTTLVILDDGPELLTRKMRPQTEGVFGSIRPDRQTVVVAPFMSVRIQRDVEQLMTNPLKVVLGKASYPAVRPNIVQRFLFPRGDRQDREDMLVDVMREVQQCYYGENSRMLIYMNSKAYLKGIVRGLNPLFHDRVQGVAEGVTQLDRVATLAALNMNPMGIVAATDVVSRVWEIEELRVVINFELPEDVGTYIDRINHLGGDGRPGLAISFFTETDEHLAPDLVRVLRECQQEVPVELLDIAARANDYVGGLGDTRWRRSEPPPTGPKRNYTFGGPDNYRRLVRKTVWPEKSDKDFAWPFGDAYADPEAEKEEQWRKRFDSETWVPMNGFQLAGHEGSYTDGGQPWTSDY